MRQLLIFTVWAVTCCVPVGSIVAGVTSFYSLQHGGVSETDLFGEAEADVVSVTDRDLLVHITEEIAMSAAGTNLRFFAEAGAAPLKRTFEVASLLGSVSDTQTLGFLWTGAGPAPVISNRRLFFDFRVEGITNILLGEDVGSVGQTSISMGVRALSPLGHFTPFGGWSRVETARRGANGIIGHAGGSPTATTTRLGGIPLAWQDYGPLTIQTFVSGGVNANGALVTLDYANTITMSAIVFEDGTTPESEGWQLVFSSGMQSPNISAQVVPEASGVVTWLLLGISATIWAGWKCPGFPNANPSSPAYRAA